MARPVMKCRWIMSWVGMLGFTCIYAIRFNLSVAIVCMVKYPEVQDNSTNGSDVISADGDPGCEAQYAKSVDWGGTLDWDRQLRGWILSSFFYGYILTQIPGGWLAGYYGGKRVLGFGMLATAIATLLVPAAARTHYSLVILLRVVMGLGTGVAFPSMHSLWAKWAPPLERTKLMIVCYAGTSIGNIVAFFGSGWLCEAGFDGGWPSIFYVSGILCLCFLLLWHFTVYDSPSHHPRISPEERTFIEDSIGTSVRGKRANIPWRAMLSSPQTWALVTAHVCNNWGTYALSTGLPSYMKDVLQFDMKHNGFYSALPYVCMLVTHISVSHTVDYIRTKGVRTVIVRKSAHAIGCIVPAVLMSCVGFVTCQRRDVAIALLVVGLAGNSFCSSGFFVNYVDIAPRYVGVLYGISNTVATLPGMVAPIVIGQVVSEGTQTEYRTVFFICAGFYLIGLTVFTIFGRGEEQAWASRKFDLANEVPKGTIIINNSEGSSDSENEL